MPRNPSTPSKEDWESYEKEILDLILVHRIKVPECCKYLSERYNFNISQRQLQRRLEAWKIKRNEKTEAVLRNLPRWLEKPRTEVWSRNDQILYQRHTRHIKKGRHDMNSGGDNAVSALSSQVEQFLQLQSAPRIRGNSRVTDIPMISILIPQNLTTKVFFNELGQNLFPRVSSGAVCSTESSKNRGGQKFVIGASERSLIRSATLIDTNDTPDIKLSAALQSYVVNLSKNNSFYHEPDRNLRYIEKHKEFRLLLESAPTANAIITRDFGRFMFRRAILARTEEESVGFLVFVPFIKEEFLIDEVLRIGRAWSFAILLRGGYISSIDNTVVLERIITRSKSINFDTIAKIVLLMQNGLQLPSLMKYSDWSPYLEDRGYLGWDLGTKLFLAAASWIGFMDYRIDKARPDHKQYSLKCLSKYIDSVEFYNSVDKLAQYLAEFCIGDFPKALINSISGISYCHKWSEELDRTDEKLYTRGPTVGDMIWPSKSIEYLCKHIDINTIWEVGENNKYHALTLALKLGLAKPVIVVLLEWGADVNQITGEYKIPREWEVETPNMTLPIPVTPLFEALRTRNIGNINLIMSKRPFILDPLPYLYVGLCYKPKVGSRESEKQKKNLAKALQTLIDQQPDGPRYKTIAQLKEFTKVIAKTGRYEMVEKLIVAGTVDVPVDVLLDAVKQRNEKIFEMFLPAPGLDGNLNLRESALRQVLERLENCSDTDDLFLTHKSAEHNVGSAAAHRPLMVLALWKHAIDCNIKPPTRLQGKMITPIFWSAIWDNDPKERQTLKDCLRDVLKLIDGQTYI